MARKFVKGYQNMEGVRVRTSCGLFLSTMGICCNVLLFTVKLLAGLLINSIPVMTDAFDNLSDVASSIIGFVGVKMTGKPVNEDHPFGRGWIEYIAAFIVAFIVIQVGFSLFKTPSGEIWNPEVVIFSVVSVVILLSSIEVRLWTSVFNRTLGKRIQSKMMLATAADFMRDVVTTGTTILSTVIFDIWDININGFIGLVVSVVVMIAGVNIAKDTLTPLIGETTDPKTYKGITNFVEQYNGIVGGHDLIVHNYGPSRSMASAHAEVPSEMDVETSHEIIDIIERECARKLDILLMIHMSPVEVTNTRVSGFRDMMVNVLTTLDSRLQLHGFRIVDGAERANLTFDLVVSRDYDSQLRDTTRLKVSEYIHEWDSRCYRIITAEDSFCAEIPEDAQK